MASGMERLQLIEDRIVVPGDRYPVTVNDGKGNILLDTRPGAVHFSGDAGRSWRRVPDFQLEGTYRVLRDGSVFGIKFANAIQDKIRRTQRNKPFIAWQRRAASVAALAAGDYEDDFAPMYIPELEGTEGDSQNYGVGFVDHGLLELPNGDLICTLYGRFRGDEVKVPYFPDGAYQYRTWCCLSKNGGKSWDYLSTIASNDVRKLPAISEGYCEAGLVQLASGDLYSVIRTGGSPSGHGSGERYTPMVACRSSDGGATWSYPEDFYRHGVWPNLIRLSGGLVVCTAGRPGVFLMVSEDDGATWSQPEIVDARDDDWSKASSGYNTLEETEPGVMALFYDEAVHANGDVRHNLRMRTYKVK